MKISARQYAQTLYDLTDGKSKAEIQKSVADFARYIYKSRKLRLADKIVEQFAKIYNQNNGIVEATAVSRKKLGENELQKIEHFVKEKCVAKKVELKNMIDENIGGGFVLKVGDEVMDGSVRGKLSDLKKALSS